MKGFPLENVSYLVKRLVIFYRYFSNKKFVTNKSLYKHKLLFALIN